MKPNKLTSQMLAVAEKNAKEGRNMLHSGTQLRFLKKVTVPFIMKNFETVYSIFVK